jgi:hypothetical protein
VADFYEHGNEVSGSIKRREFPDQLNNCQFLKKDFIPWNQLYTVINEVQGTAANSKHSRSLSKKHETKQVITYEKGKIRQKKVRDQRKKAEINKGKTEK